MRALVPGYLDWVVAQPERARFALDAWGAIVAGRRTPKQAEAARRRKQALEAWHEPHRRTAAVRDLLCELIPSLFMGPKQSYCRA